MLHSLEWTFPKFSGQLFSYNWPLLSIFDHCQGKWLFCLWFTYYVALRTLESLLCMKSGHLSPQHIWSLSNVSWSVVYFISKKKKPPRPLAWMSFTLTLIFWKNMVISSLGKRLICHHRSSKEKKRKAGKRETRNGKHFWMTETLIRKKEDWHELNTKGARYGPCQF